MYSPWDVLLHLSVFAFPLHDIGYQVCQNAKTNCVTIKKRIFNEAMVKKVGANDFLAKFHPDELAIRVNKRIEQINEEGESVE